MYGKLAIAAGFAAGNVLGSKAGRQRYEEIVAQARKVAGNETVQSTAGVLQAKGTELVDKAKQSDIASKVKSTVGKDKDADDVASGTTVTTYETVTPAITTPSPTTDLFEPSGGPTDAVVVDETLVIDDPLRPANSNGQNNI